MSSSPFVSGCAALRVPAGGPIAAAECVSRPCVVEVAP